MGSGGIIFGGYKGIKNIWRLLTLTEIKKRNKKKAEAINGQPYASTISEPRRMRGRESGRTRLECSQWRRGLSCF
jgi:hypothetical protein